MNIILNLKMVIPVEPLKKVGSADSSGTSITFMPSKNTFTKTNFDFSKLETRLRELAYLKFWCKYKTSRYEK